MQNQILDLLIQSVDIKLVIILMVLGFAVKHFCKKITNEAIPIILIVLGIGLAIVLGSFGSRDDIMASIICGIASGCVAVGLHQAGKTLWGIMGGDKPKPEEIPTDPPIDNENK